MAWPSIIERNSVVSTLDVLPACLPACIASVFAPVRNAPYPAVLGMFGMGLLYDPSRLALFSEDPVGLLRSFGQLVPGSEGLAARYVELGRVVLLVDGGRSY